MKQWKRLGMAVALSACGALGIAGPAAAGKYDGVTVNVVTFTGPQIAEPLQRRAPDFQKLTGAKINVITVPFSDFYTKLLSDFATGTNSYDAAVFAPQWMVDFIEPGYLQEITDRVKSDTALKWDDIGPFFRDFSATYNGKVYTIPLDGDFQMVYYRSDLLKQANMAPLTAPALPRSAAHNRTGWCSRSPAASCRARAPARACSSIPTPWRRW
jgi:multiple sugar transport system substrate-binding protein